MGLKECESRDDDTEAAPGEDPERMHWTRVRFSAPPPLTVLVD